MCQNEDQSLRQLYERLYIILICLYAVYSWGSIAGTLAAMSMGTAVVKVKGPGRCTVKTLYLDSNKTSLRWKPSKKGNKARSKFVFESHHHKM